MSGAARAHHAGDRPGGVPGGTVCGIDVSAGLIARAEAASAGQRNVRFEVADIREERWEAAFDIVTSARVLQWLADPARAVAAMARAARPGGTTAVWITITRGRSGIRPCRPTVPALLSGVP